MMLIRASDNVNDFGWAIPPFNPPSHFCSVRMDSGTAGGTVGGTSAGFNAFARFGWAAKDDPENLFDLNNNWYTVPENGIYLVNAYMRLPDNAGNTYFGIGADVAETDTDNFMWTAKFYVNGPTQWGQQYTRVMRLVAGQQLRFFGYNVTFKPSRAVMTICMLSRG